MPLMFLGFFLLTLFWLFWAVAWVVVWAIALLFWPVALLIAGWVLWRALMRGPRRSVGAQAARNGRPAAPSRKGAFRHGAFEEYRQETIARLEEERQNFREFLERRRRSRDKQEFDTFMAGRRGRPAIPQGDSPAA